MLTHVEFRSSAFPSYDPELGEVNPGRYGLRLAEFLADVLQRAGEVVREPVAEDWGWIVPLENPEFRLWIGVGNYLQYPQDGFLCFIYPQKEHVRRLFKKVVTVSRVSEVREKIDTALRAHPEVRDIKWWSEEEFNSPTP